MIIPTKPMKCAHIIVSGKVQGVFFRDNVRKKATQLGLKGYAQNLPDGTVEVEAEGSEHELNELLGFIRQSPGASKVDRINVIYKAQQNFQGFEVY